MTIEKNSKVTQLLDELLKDYWKPEDILGESGLLMQFNKAIVERAQSSLSLPIILDTRSTIRRATIAATPATAKAPRL